MNATVRWFDALSGEGVVRLESGESVFIHYSAIARGVPLDKEFFYRLLFPGQKIKVNVTFDSHYRQVEEVL